MSLGNFISALCGALLAAFLAALLLNPPHVAYIGIAGGAAIGGILGVSPWVMRLVTRRRS